MVFESMTNRLFGIRGILVIRIINAVVLSPEVSVTICRKQLIMDFLVILRCILFPFKLIYPYAKVVQEVEKTTSGMKNTNNILVVINLVPCIIYQILDL